MALQKSQAHFPPATPHSHNPEDTDIRLLSWTVMWIVVAIIVTLVVVAVMYKGLAKLEEALAPSPAPMSEGREVPPSPRLQVDPGVDRAHMDRAEDTLLGSYGWVDRRAGTVHIPIDRAMELVAQGQGVPGPTTQPSGGGR